MSGVIQEKRGGGAENIDPCRKKTFISKDQNIFETHATHNRCHFYFILGIKREGTVIFRIQKKTN